MPDPQAVIDFWFSPESQARWFQSTPEFDTDCRDRFAGWIDKASRGDLDDWQETAEGTLALTLLLDQLPRNIYRGSSQAFAYDTRALAIAKDALDKGFDRELPKSRRFFVYLPLEHSENLDDQNRSVELFMADGDAMKIDYAIRHLVIIERFGRFPHRNAVLGRESTEEELAFLKEPNSSF